MYSINIDPADPWTLVKYMYTIDMLINIHMYTCICQSHALAIPLTCTYHMKPYPILLLYIIHYRSRVSCQGGFLTCTCKSVPAHVPVRLYLYTCRL